MPEWPAHGYSPYRAWGRLPAADDPRGWPARLADWLLGSRTRLLYLGITSRAGFCRWVEESDTWTWARDVSTVERDDGIVWPTLHDAVVDAAGHLIVVLDAAQDDGARPARPDELLDPQPHAWRMRDGRDVLAYRTHPAGRPARTWGTVIEGARTGERRMIQAEAPIRNVEHNEGNPHAVNRVRRVLPRHIAARRRQAATLTLGWIALAALLTWALHDGGGALAGLAAAGDGLAIAAVLILLGQIGRTATRGRVHVATRRRPPGRARRAARR